MAVVDIIIPLYNKERTVARTIQSVLEQTVQDWRLIVVNDGSTDNSVGRVREFSDPRIEIIEQENHGPGPARNAGIKAATAEYVAFLDADDQWHPWYLENALAAFEKDQVAVVGTMYEEWPERVDMTAYWEKRKVRPGVYQLKGDENPGEVLEKLFFFHVGNTMVRTAQAVEVGGFYDEEKCLLGEDTVFFIKLLFNQKFAIIAPTAVRHNRQDSGLSNLTDRPLDIFLQKPEIVLRSIPQDKIRLAESVLAWHALRTAHFRARNGFKADALYLKDNYPAMKRFPFLYHKLRLEIALSRWLPYWVKCKCTIGSLLRNRRRKPLHETPASTVTQNSSGDKHDQ